MNLRSGKSLIVYSIALAGAAVALQWLDYRWSLRRLSTETYIAIIALSFSALGLWLGVMLTRRKTDDRFEVNRSALDYLEITAREYQVLELLAEGRSNQEIADRLHISANTVKTHLARLYDKLEVSRRTQATAKARSLRLIR